MASLEDQMQGLRMSEVDPDPEGDVTVSVGPNSESAICFRVSSKVLSLASPVFAKMFNPNFSEGSALLANRSCLVTLPDDNAEAALWFFRAIHFQEDAAEIVSFTMFVELAIFCDKYDCSKALSPWSYLWVEKFRYWSRDNTGGRYDSVRDRNEIMLFTSFAYGHHEAFWDNSRLLLRNLGRGDDLGSGLDVFFPAGLIKSIKDQSEEILISLQTAFDSLLRPYLSAESANATCQNIPSADDHTREIAPPRYSNSSHSPTPPPPYTPTACLRHDKIAHCFRELTYIGFWPLSQIPYHTVDEVLTQTFRYKNYVQPRDHPCRCIDVDFHNSLIRASERIVRAVNGLCLNCVRQGKFDKERNCGLRHKCANTDSSV